MIHSYQIVNALVMSEVSSPLVDTVHCGETQQSTYVLGLRTIHLTLSLGILMNTFSPALIVSGEAMEAMVVFAGGSVKRQGQNECVVLREVRSFGLLTTEAANPLRPSV